jgi:hypothetical protein
VPGQDVGTAVTYGFTSKPFEIIRAHYPLVAMRARPWPRAASPAGPAPAAGRRATGRTW